MTQVSRPLLIALAVVVAFLGVWMVALKPSSSSTTASTAVTTPHTAGAAAAGSSVAPRPPSSTVSARPPAGTITTPSAAQLRPRTGTHVTPAPPPAGASAAALRRFDTVGTAIRANKVVAMLFYNPAAADDREVKRELAAVPRDAGRVVALAVPISEVTRYPVVASQVMLSSSPTLVVIDGDQQATTIVGFADSLEISQRIANALSVA